jgi:hypothetical protein
LYEFVLSSLDIIGSGHLFDHLNEDVNLTIQVEDYNMEVSLHGYENEYEMSDDDHETSIFDNDRI